MGLLSWYVRGEAIAALQEQERRSHMPRLGPAQAAAARHSAVMHGEGPSQASADWLRDILLNRVLPAKDGKSGSERAAEGLRMLDRGELTQREVSRAIDRYRNCPRKSTAHDRAQQGPSLIIPGAEKIPAGRYALLDPESGELRFYRLWRGNRNPNYIALYVEHGPEGTKIPWNVPTYANLLGRILEYGPLESSILYARNIGACGVCGLRLTNHLSRHLGIGPVCGGRYFTNDPAEWRRRKAVARSELRAQGIDPEESIE